MTPARHLAGSAPRCSIKTSQTAPGPVHGWAPKPCGNEWRDYWKNKGRSDLLPGAHLGRSPTRQVVTGDEPYPGSTVSVSPAEIWGSPGGVGRAEIGKPEPSAGVITRLGGRSGTDGRVGGLRRRLPPALGGLDARDGAVAVRWGTARSATGPAGTVALSDHPVRLPPLRRSKTTDHRHGRVVRAPLGAFHEGEPPFCWASPAHSGSMQQCPEGVRRRPDLDDVGSQVPAAAR
jgi:hypothetical protein